MARFYEQFKSLVLATTFCGLYFPAIENLYGTKWYIKALKFISVIPLTLFPTFLFSSLKIVFFDENSIVDKAHGAIFSIYGFFISFLAHSYHFNQRKFVKIFELWDSLFEEDLFSEERKALILENTKPALKWLKLFGSFSVLDAMLYSIVAYFYSNKTLDHPSGFPYKHAFPEYELVVTFEVFVSSFGFATMICHDCILSVLLALEDAQLKHLKNSLDKIIRVLTVTESGEVENHVTESFNDDLSIIDNQDEKLFMFVEKKLQLWISHHRQILQFHQAVRKLYFWPISIKFFTFIFLICLVSFLSIAEGGFGPKDIILGYLFCANNYAVFYANIKLADSICETSELVFQDAFASAWYTYPKKFKTYFQMILLQSTRPAHFLAFGVYSANSRNFMKMIYTGFSFFTFLLQISGQKPEI